MPSFLPRLILAVARKRSDDQSEVGAITSVLATGSRGDQARLLLSFPLGFLRQQVPSVIHFTCACLIHWHGRNRTFVSCPICLSLMHLSKKLAVLQVTFTSEAVEEDPGTEDPRVQISYPKFASMCEKGDTIFVGRYLVTGSEESSAYLEVHTHVHHTSVRSTQEHQSLEHNLQESFAQHAHKAKLQSPAQTETKVEFRTLLSCRSMRLQRRMSSAQLAQMHSLRASSLFFTQSAPQMVCQISRMTCQSSMMRTRQPLPNSPRTLRWTSSVWALLDPPQILNRRANFWTPSAWNPPRSASNCILTMNASACKYSLTQAVIDRMGILRQGWHWIRAHVTVSESRSWYKSQFDSSSELSTGFSPLNLIATLPLR